MFLMKLALFDIDGTLTESNLLDNTCYLRAFDEEMGVRGINCNWLDYEHSTNSGIALQICREHILRHPSREEIERLKRRYFDLVQETILCDGGCIRMIPGSAPALVRLMQEPQWRVGIATGGWRESAVMKLERVGIPHERLPIATADECLSRPEIIRQAIEQSRACYECAEFEKVVYVGDGLWDIRAARELGLAFLGRGEGEDAQRLREEGALHIIPDYVDFAGFLKALEEAAAPTDLVEGA